MKPFKVLIVDDEVLAIEHLKKTICWEDYGFTVVAETSFAKRALSLVSAHMPDVIFMDIRMPYMDGLELSKLILSTHKMTKIILLTSYRDFEYVKDALKIGVFDYMLKHELDANQLIKELERIKNILISNKQEENNMLRQKLRSLLQNEHVSRNEVTILQEKFQNFTSFFLMMLEIDKPFPVIEGGSSPIKDHLVIAWEDQITEDELSHFPLLIMTSTRTGQAVCLFSVTRTLSSKQLREHHQEMANRLQQQIRNDSNLSISITISPLFQHISQVRAIYEQLEKVVSVNRLPGRGRIVYTTDRIESSPFEMTEIKAWFHELEQQMGRFDSRGVHDTLERIFRRLAVSQAHPETLLATCKFLTSLIDKHRQQANLSPTIQLLQEGKLDESAWYTLDGIWNWYKDQFTLLVELWNVDKNLQVNKKIQRAKSFIHHNYQQDLSIEQVGHAIGTSGEYIRHLFKESTGNTLIEYITEVRMEKAKELILSGQYKMYEISTLVGYKSSQYFAKVFKQYTGYTPQSFMEGNVKSREVKN
jgi:two-component system response regulator YesN